MRNKILLALLFFVFFQLVNVKAQVGEWMKFTDTTHVFGNIAEDGGPVSHEFEFMNAGPDDFKLLNVQASCGCTVPDWTRQLVRPGETGTIKVQYNPRNRPGPFKKSLTVTSSVGKLELHIEGNVIPRPKSPEEEYPVLMGNLRVKHHRLNMGKMVTNKSVTRTFPLFNQGSKSISFENIQYPDYLEVKIIPRLLEPGEIGNLIISLDPVKKKEYGHDIEPFEVKTDDESMPVKTFNLVSTIYEYFPPVSDEDYAEGPRLEIDEPAFDVGDIKEGDIATHIYQMTNVGQSTLNIRKLIANCNCVTTKLDKKNVAPGETVSIKVAFNSSQRKGTQHKIITIHSNDPRKSAINLTLIATVK